MRVEPLIITTTAKKVSQKKIWSNEAPFALDYFSSWIVQLIDGNILVRYVGEEKKDITRPVILIKDEYIKNQTQIPLTSHFSVVFSRPKNLSAAFKSKSSVFGLKHQGFHSYTGIGKQILAVQTCASAYIASIRKKPAFLVEKKDALFNIQAIFPHVRIKIKGKPSVEMRVDQEFLLTKEDFFSVSLSYGLNWWKFSPVVKNDVNGFSPRDFSESKSSSSWFQELLFFCLVLFSGFVFWVFSQPSIPQEKSEKEQIPPIVKYVIHRVKPPIPPVILPKPIVPEKKVEPIPVVLKKEKPVLAKKAPAAAPKKMMSKTSAPHSAPVHIEKKISQSPKKTLSPHNIATIVKKNTLSHSPLLTQAPRSLRQNPSVTAEQKAKQAEQAKLKDIREALTLGLKGVNLQGGESPSHELTSNQTAFHSHDLHNQLKLSGEVYKGEGKSVTSLSQSSGVSYANAARLHGENTGASYLSSEDGGKSEGFLVEQGLTKNEVGEVIHRHMSEVRYCDETAMVKGMRVEGRLLVSFTVNAKGQVIEVNKVSSDKNLDFVSHCVMEKLKKWVFPKPRGGINTTVNYPFLFKSLHVD
jgi:TonB family protein